MEGARDVMVLRRKVAHRSSLQAGREVGGWGFASTGRAKQISQARVTSWRWWDLLKGAEALPSFSLTPSSPPLPPPPCPSVHAAQALGL